MNMKYRSRLAIFCLFLMLMCACQKGGTRGSAVSIADVAQQQRSSADTLRGETANIFMADSVSRHVEECAEWLADAYRRWMRRSYPKDSALWHELFTPAMEMKRCRANNGCDYVTRAQDYTEYALQHISCRPLTEGWYEVTYAWRDEEPVMRIPVQVVWTDDGWRIGYISPYWAEDQDYNRLFDIVPDTIDDCSASRLVQTFYSQYASIYALMNPGLEEQLETLRKTYATERLNRQFEKVRLALEGDMDEGFDIVIMGHDFDIHSFKSLKIEPLESTSFRVSYREGKERVTAWEVSVTCIDGHWKMDGIDAGDHWISSTLNE